MGINPITIWLDQTYINVNKEFNIRIHLSLCKIDPYLVTFRDVDKCLNYIRNLNCEDKIIVIISSNTSSDIIFLQQCDELPQIKSIFILNLPDIQICQTMSKPCEIHPDIQSLCNHLRQLPNIRRCRREGFVRDDFNINVIRYSSNLSDLSTTNNEMISSSSSSLNDSSIKQQETDFIYEKLLGKILVTVNSTKQEMIQFCREKCSDNETDLQNIEDFEEYYDSCNAIFWYTRDTFLYRLLNKSLREQDFNTIYSLRYFIKDLDYQLSDYGCQQRLLLFTVPSNDDDVTYSSPQTIYRGQLMANEEFNKRIRFNVGGFLSVNTFFSTTTRRDLAVVYAGNRSNNEASPEQSVLFQIEISHNYHEYADISKQSAFSENEGEILFTMGAVFQIVSVNLINEGFWEVKMRLNAEEDFELADIADSLRRETISPSPCLSLGKLMFATANYDKAEHFHLLALHELEISKANDIIPAVYNGLSIIYNKTGQLEKATKYYRESYIACVLHLSTKDSEFAHAHNNLGMISRQRNDYNKAILHYNRALEIELNLSIPDTSQTAIYYNNIGGVYFAQRIYSEALNKFQECLKLLEELPPAYHSFLAIPYNNISQVHYVLGNYNKAYRRIKKTIEIQLRSLPSDHPDLATSYNNLSLIYEKQGQTQEAREMHEKARQLRLKNVSSICPNIVTTTYTVVAEFITSTN